VGTLDNYGEDDDPSLRGDKRIIHRAKQRFIRCKTWYEEAYGRSLEDTKFANADDRNHWQWPDRIYADRDVQRKPCLTINKTKVHNRMIANESMEHKASIRVRPTGGDATVDAAEGYQALINRIEYISTATAVYRGQIVKQIDGGLGYFYLQTDYVDDKSFNQDIYIRGSVDPRSVYIDPEATKEGDGSNAEFGFIFEIIARDKFNKEYPRFKDKIGAPSNGYGTQSTLGFDKLWMDEKHVLLAMYYERESKNDELIAFRQEDGSMFHGHRSELEKQAGPELVEAVIAQIDNGDLDGQYRDVITQSVKWYRIAGDWILKRGDWAGRYIPIIPLYGEKTIIEGKLDLKGHTRAMVSPQQMLNYNASGQVQFGALQSRTPYIGPMKAFEANEEQWATANVQDYAYLGYTDFVKEEGEEGREVQMPKRQDPPQSAPVFAQGMADAERQLMMVSGQWQAQLGEQDQQSAASGKAIAERQRQGDTATYHFIEHQYDAYRYLGKQLIDLIPKIYDTARILHVEAPDGTRQVIRIDPDMQEAVKKLKEEADAAEEIVMNPAVGEYEVISDPGPNYATQRQQAWDAIAMIIQQSKELVAVIGDLLFKNGDFPGALEIQERLKKEIQATKPYLFADGADPQSQAAQQQIQKLVGMNSELLQKLAEMKLSLKGKQELRDVEAYNADTKRLEAQIKFLTTAMLTPAQRAEMEHDIEMQTRDHLSQLIIQANEPSVSNGANGSS
jgi:hypothetical protein